MARMEGVLSLDRESAIAVVRGGTRAPALEAYLRVRGLTLGHFPQSYEYVSLGGCAATRSAGQASTGYGAIERMITGLRLVAPAAEIDLPAMPATAAGPGLRQTLIGSEGSARRDQRARAARAARLRARASTRACSSRTSPRACTRCASSRASARSPTWRVCPTSPRRACRSRSPGAAALKGRLGRAYLGLRGYREGCLAILGFEGDAERGGPPALSARSRIARAQRRPRRGRLAGPRLARVALRGSLSARRPAHARRDGGDARDRRPPGRTSAPCTARSSGRSPRRWQRAERRGS